MNADEILRSIIDCEACGHDWPRLCAWHADRVEAYADRRARAASLRTAREPARPGGGSHA